MNYKEKYLKYKRKYLLLKNNDLIGGGVSPSFVRRPIYNDYINVKISTSINWRYKLPLYIYYINTFHKLYNDYNKKIWTKWIKIKSNKNVIPPSIVNKYPDNLKSKFLYNNNNLVINPLDYEVFDQFITTKWISKNDIVLELGGRVGVVSNNINYLLDKKYKAKHYVVEPDLSVINTLKENKKRMNSQFNIIDKPLTNSKYILNNSGLATQFIKDINGYIEGYLIKNPNFLIKKRFNVLVADCEGCLCEFIKENFNDMKKYLELIIFEVDGLEICSYEEIHKILLNNNFILVDTIPFSNKNHYEVYSKIIKNKKNSNYTLFTSF